jgi:hypothetical protein
VRFSSTVSALGTVAFAKHRTDQVLLVAAAKHADYYTAKKKINRDAVYWSLKMQLQLPQRNAPFRRSRNRDKHNPSSNGGARAVLELFVGGPGVAKNNQTAQHLEHRCATVPPFSARDGRSRKHQNGSRFCGAQQTCPIVLFAKINK